MHGEGHLPGDHERADEAAGDRDERGSDQRVLGERLAEEETGCPSAMPIWEVVAVRRASFRIAVRMVGPAGAVPPTTTMRSWTLITSMWLPYRALRVSVVITVSGLPAAHRPRKGPGRPGPRRGDLVGDEHHRGALLAVVTVEEGHDCLLGGGVEREQRLVAQQQPRGACQRLGDPQPLLLPARQQPDRRPRIGGCADRGDGVVDPAGAGPRQAAPVPVDTELDQVPAADRQAGVENPLLGDVADLGAAPPSDRPSMVTVPATSSTFSSVVLPAPFGPRMARHSPGATSRSRFSQMTW